MLGLWNDYKTDNPLERPIKIKREKAKVIMLGIKRDIIIKIYKY